MRRLWIGSLAAAGILLAYGIEMDSAGRTDASTSGSLGEQDAPPVSSVSAVKLRTERQSPTDLEIGGELRSVPRGASRYLTREDLLTLPQVTYTVTDDSNFTGPTEISGVPLEELTRALGAVPQEEMVVAICDDKYRTNYPHDYVAAHHPLLVLTINGQPPSGWPKDSGGHGYDMGPYLVSHPAFTPSFKIFSHADEPQIPWGVVRIELRKQNAVFGAIAPRGNRAATARVEAGYRIARQNCFRCHNMGREGGQKSGISWWVLSKRAVASSRYFADYVRDPRAKNPVAQMPANSGYDDRTIEALTAYFQTFPPPDAASILIPPQKGKP
jgi:mono/diheme cytochrome c family protein